MGQSTLTAQAEALFDRFARRHGLAHAPVEAPVDLLWDFPAQPGLAHPIQLGLQGDALTFAAGKFWSAFPVAEGAAFDLLLDAWVAGMARVATYRWLGGQDLEVMRDGRWRRIHTAYGWNPLRRGATYLSNL